MTVKLLGTDPVYRVNPLFTNQAANQKVYPMKNFGWQITPFYTVLWHCGWACSWCPLSWHGSSISCQKVKSENTTTTKPLQSYLGKLPLYVRMGSAQATLRAWMGECPEVPNRCTGSCSCWAFCVCQLHLRHHHVQPSLYAGNAGKRIWSSSWWCWSSYLELAACIPWKSCQKIWQRWPPFMPFTYCHTTALQEGKVTVSEPPFQNIIGHDDLLFLNSSSHLVLHSSTRWGDCLKSWSIGWRVSMEDQGVAGSVEAGG